MSQTALRVDTPLWDRVIILASTSPNDVAFFQTQRGKPDPAVPTGPPKTFADTNLGKSMELPDPESFTVQVIRLMFDPGTAEADITKILNTSYLEFRTSGDSITAWAAPTMIVPAGAGFPFSATSTAQNGFPSPSAVYKLVNPIELYIGESFLVYIHFLPGSPGSTAVGAAAALSANVKARCVLEGDHWMVDALADEVDANGKLTGKRVGTRRSAGARGQ